ncbi:SprT-like domain-containing protein [Algoriphagus mannitolivorans]|uniref:SprT-like domain-containing protein n=1 Tax=Algoriphagus mannitolivorans TaxID=226504 RepID=UPI0004092D74|nr:SprT-like domain-containing protein [Algoriphagus mannitolivorans]
MNNSGKFKEILALHLPKSAVSYCLSLWEETPFSFSVKNPRATKLGDFRYRKDQKIQSITINSDLNPYQFLLTFIHEVAHLRTFEKYGMAHAPHGKEWKRTFQSLMLPLLSEEIFPKDILIPLKLHMSNPAASLARDLFLMKEMSKYDQSKRNTAAFFLSDLAPGSVFQVAGRKFKKGETRRTRVVCEEITTGKKYLISRLAKVDPA